MEIRQQDDFGGGLNACDRRSTAEARRVSVAMLKLAIPVPYGLFSLSVGDAMNLAVFLDVDRTLTREYIQQGYAREIGCESEYRGIEAKLQSKQIDETRFGTELIALFASKQFSEARARELFGRIALQPWTHQLLSIETVDKFLVSSGPSYYIDSLAEKYRIPKDNVCRSKYRFNQSGVISSCDAVNPAQKAQFVRERAARYAVAIGVGDHPEFDGPFVSHCTIPLLTKQTNGYIYTPDLNSVVLLMNNLSTSPVATAKSAGNFETSKLTIPQLWNSLRIEAWIFLFTLFGGVGALIAKYLSQPTK
jgi:phosphoserine phosphatase